MTPDRVEEIFRAVYLGLTSRYDARKYGFRLKKAQQHAAMPLCVASRIADQFPEELVVRRMAVANHMMNGTYGPTIDFVHVLQSYVEWRSHILSPDLFITKKINPDEDEFGPSLFKKVVGGDIHCITMFQVHIATDCMNQWKWKPWLKQKTKWLRAFDYLEFQLGEMAASKRAYGSCVDQ